MSSTPCTVYRCSKQDQMYLYLREGLDPKTLPPALLTRAGQLTRVMDVQLGPDRKLARVDVQRVVERLASDGWYLQLPPDGHIRAHLHFGD